MTNQLSLTAETDFKPRVARRVYCTEEAHLRLSDGTPLHLQWIIEDTDGKLYTVCSELGGWLRRTPYEGSLDGMKLVSSEKARSIMWLTYADTDDDATASVHERDGSAVTEHRGDVLKLWAY